MKMWVRLLCASIIALMSVSLSSATHRFGRSHEVGGTIHFIPQDAKNHFGQGKRLIDANCGDCVGATKQGLEQGIAEVVKAIQLGYEDKKSAYSLLANAYNTLGIVFSAPSSDEQKATFESRQAVYEELLKLDPQNVQVNYEYAMTLQDTAKQLKILKEVIRLNPSYADAHFSSGVLLIQKGDTEEGIVELERSVQLANEQQVEVFGRRLIDVLNERGRKDDAQRIWRTLEKKKK